MAQQEQEARRRIDQLLEQSSAVIRAPDMIEFRAHVTIIRSASLYQTATVIFANASLNFSD